MLQNAYSPHLEFSVLDEVAEEAVGGIGARDKLTKFTYHDGSECTGFVAFLKAKPLLFNHTPALAFVLLYPSAFRRI